MRLAGTNALNKGNFSWPGAEQIFSSPQGNLITGTYHHTDYMSIRNTIAFFAYYLLHETLKAVLSLLHYPLGPILVPS